MGRDKTLCIVEGCDHTRRSLGMRNGKRYYSSRCGHHRYVRTSNSFVAQAEPVANLNTETREAK